MKKPNLQSNYYYPFYTQERTGKKKYYNKVNTIMHLSDKKGIIISMVCDNNKIKEVTLRRIDNQNDLYQARRTSSNITYSDFSKEIKKVYRFLSDAEIVLATEPAYLKILVFGVYFKYNADIEFEIDGSEIKLKYGRFEYKIEDEKRIDLEEAENSFGGTNREEDALWEKIQRATAVFRDSTKYREISQDEFASKLQREWEKYFEYFEAPKFIRKTEYKL